MKEKDKIDASEIDHILRDTVNVIRSLSDQLFYGIYDDFAIDDKDKFRNELKEKTEKLYETLNKSVVNKANEINELNQIIMEMNTELDIMNDELARANDMLLDKNEELKKGIKYRKKGKRRRVDRKYHSNN